MTFILLQVGLSLCCLLTITGIFYSHRDQDHLISVLNEELIKIDSWMRSNKLSVNMKKTNYFVFKSAQKKALSDLPLSFNSQILKEKNSVKFLGVYIDNSPYLEIPISTMYVKTCQSLSVLFSDLASFLQKQFCSLFIILKFTLVYPIVALYGLLRILLT